MLLGMISLFIFIIEIFFIENLFNEWYKYYYEYFG